MEAECSHSLQSDFSGVQAADRAAECPPAWLLCPDRSVEDRKNQSSSQQCGTRLLWCHQGSCKTKIHPSSPVVLVIGRTFRVVIFAECTILLLLMVAAPRHGVRTTTSPMSPCSWAWVQYLVTCISLLTSSPHPTPLWYFNSQDYSALPLTCDGSAANVLSARANFLSMPEGVIL